MAYEAHEWKTGEEITAEKLNHMEGGISNVGIETNIQNPTDGQTLKYDAASGKWVNGEGGGSSTLVVNATTDDETEITTLDKTWQEISDAFPNVCLVDGNAKMMGLLSVRIEGGVYFVYVAEIQPTKVTAAAYTTTAADGYPNDDERGGGEA